MDDEEPVSEMERCEEGKGAGRVQEEQLGKERLFKC